MTQGIEFPTGAIVKYRVPSTAPVAYLNSGEQVVRGPTPPGVVTVDAVFVLGNTFREVAQNSQPTELPPRAPYQAPAGAPDFQAWVAQATVWVGTR
jgi:hypothetical protein